MTGSVASVSAPAAAPASGSSSSSTPAPSTSGAEVKAPQTGPANDNGKAANDNGAPKPPPKPEPPQRFKYKHGDQEIDLDPADAWREIQKARHYDKTRPDFERERQEFYKERDALLKDPAGYLKQQKVDLKQLALQDLMHQAELEKMTPEQRELSEMKAELARRDKLESERVEAEKQAAAQQEHQSLVQNTVRTIDAAIKASGLKRSGELVRLYAEVMELAEHAGEPPMSPEQLVAAGDRLHTQRTTAAIERAIADAQWRGRNPDAMKKLAMAVFQNLSDPELIEFVGKENAMKLARAQLQAYRKNPIPTVAETPPNQTQATSSTRQMGANPDSMYAILDRLQSR